MKKIARWMVLASLLFSCQNKDNQQTKTVETTKDSSLFFPVSSYLKGQMHELDSLPITPLYISTIKNKIDSVWLKKDSLKLLLAPFFADEINDTNLKNYFTETKFKDLSINKITFTYTASQKLPDSIQIRHWDVYVNPETGTVSKIYIVRIFTKNNRKILQQLTWNSNKSAKIVSISNDADNQILSEESFIWNFN